MRMKSIVGTLGGALLALACSSEAVDIGDERTRTFGESLADYNGSWDGYAEAYSFEFAENSDRLRLSIDASGSGTLQVGDGTASVPPVDPNVAPFGPWTIGADGPGRLVAGFRYPLHDLRVEDRRLRFTIDPTDLMRPWCQTQTPTLVANFGAYYCNNGQPYYTFGDGSPCWVEDTSTGEAVQVEIDCGKAFLCQPQESLCRCDASSCDALAWPEILTPVDLALTVDGSEIEGTLLTAPSNGDSKTPVRVRLVR